MEADAELFFALAEALGIGLLIGIEREQQAHRSGKEASAGVRTFTLASLVGALSMLAGGVPLLAVAVVIVGVVRVAWILVRGDQTVGLTTSLALITAMLLGALAIETATMAAGVAVLIASLLAARELLHNFSRTVLTAVELRDGLILGVSILVILPALPNLDVGPGGALNPRNLFIIIVLIMSIGAAGHIATRVVGARLGLPLSGFLSGFVSSTATIAALGRRAGDNPDEVRSASAGAALSSVSSLMQIGIILFVLSPAMFAAGVPVLLGAGLAAALYGAGTFLLSMHGNNKPEALELPSQVFSVKGAIKFMLIVASVMLVSAILSERFGGAAVLPAVALAGLVSTNSAAVALASLVAAGQMPAIDGALPLAAALSRQALDIPASQRGVLPPERFRWPRDSAVGPLGGLVAGRIHTGLVRDLTSGCGRHCRLPIAGEACECQQATRQYRSPTLARAIWFAQNFSEGHLREAALAGDAASSAGNNSEPIMDVDDIAAVAETIGDVPRSGTLNSRSACSSVVGENVNRPLSRLSNAAKSAEKPHRATLPAEPFPGTVVQGGVLLNT